MCDHKVVKNKIYVELILVIKERNSFLIVCVHVYYIKLFNLFILQLIKAILDPLLFTIEKLVSNLWVLCYVSCYSLYLFIS